MPKGKEILGSLPEFVKEEWHKERIRQSGAYKQVLDCTYINVGDFINSTIHWSASRLGTNFWNGLFRNDYLYAKEIFDLNQNK